jgi:hypothetical protein
MRLSIPIPSSKCIVLNRNFVFSLHEIHQEHHPGVKQDVPVYTESDIRGSEGGLLVCDLCNLVDRCHQQYLGTNLCCIMYHTIMVIVQRKALCLFQDKGIFNNLLGHHVQHLHLFIHLFIFYRKIQFLSWRSHRLLLLNFDHDHSGLKSWMCLAL